MPANKIKMFKGDSVCLAEKRQVKNLQKAGWKTETKESKEKESAVIKIEQPKSVQPSLTLPDD